MNSRTTALLNRIELFAKKNNMSVEDAMDILEGKHPTHRVRVTPIEKGEEYDLEDSAEGGEDGKEKKRNKPDHFADKKAK